MKRAANKTAVKTEDGKKPFMYSRIYDSSDVNEAAKTALHYPEYKYDSRYLKAARGGACARAAEHKYQKNCL